MKNFLLFIAAAIINTNAASADIIFNVNAHMKVATLIPELYGIDAGDLTGTVRYDDTLSTVSQYTLALTSGGGFYPFSYEITNSRVNVYSDHLYFYSTINSNAMELYFPGGLVPAGSVISPSSSYDFQPSVELVRSISGTMTRLDTAVPEPATWGLMVIGISAAGWRFRRRSGISLQTTNPRRAAFLTT